MSHTLADKGIDQETLRLDGVIQRVDYGRREVKVVAEGRVFLFVLAADSRLLFDRQPAILRCFHPLDPVHIEFVESSTGPRILAMHGWERSSCR